MDRKIEEYINKQGSPQKEICIRLREIIIDTFPDIIEEFKWGVPTYSVKKDGKNHQKYYIGSFKKQVNLGFNIKDLDPENVGKLEGTGKTMRHIKIFSMDDIDEDRIIEQLRMIPY